MTKSDRDLPSNVYKLWNRYYIAQTRNGEKKVYGRYDTREEAIRVRDHLIAEGVLVRPGEHCKTCHPDRYIHRKSDGCFHILKWWRGRLEYFGVFRSLEDAREERDFLESIGWDYSNMD